MDAGCVCHAVCSNNSPSFLTSGCNCDRSSRRVSSRTKQWQHLLKLWQPTGVNVNTSATNPPDSYVSGTMHTLYVLTDYGIRAVFKHLTMHHFTTATSCYKAFLSDKRHWLEWCCKATVVIPNIYHLLQSAFVTSFCSSEHLNCIWRVQLICSVNIQPQLELIKMKRGAGGQPRRDP